VRDRCKGFEFSVTTEDDLVVLYMTKKFANRLEKQVGNLSGCPVELERVWNDLHVEMKRNAYCSKCEGSGGLVRYGRKSAGEPHIVHSVCDCRK
jgi:hypothetical protein